MNHTPQHPVQTQGFTRAFVFLMMGLTCAGTVLVMKLRERPTPERAAAALADTVAPQQTIGPSTVAAGHAVTESENAAKLKTTMGAPLSRRVVSTAQASGFVPATASPLQFVVTLPVETGWTADAVQDRGGLPPLTTAHVAFDAVAGLRVAWKNRLERFDVSTAEWRTDKDGLRLALRLSRTVDGRTEEIPLEKADAHFTVSEVTRLAPIPRFGLAVGAGRDALGRVRPNVLFERPITRNDSFITGHVNGGVFAMYKRTWGAQ